MQNSSIHFNNSQGLTSMTCAMYKALTGNEPPANITKTKAKAVIHNRMAKRRSKLNKKS